MMTRLRPSAAPGQRLKSLGIQRLAVTLGGTLGVQAFVMASGILAARSLGVEGRGHQALFTVVNLAVGQFASLGVPVAMAYRIAQKQDAAASLHRQVASMMRHQAAVGLVVGAGVVVVASLGDGGSVLLAGLIGALGIPFYVATAYQLGTLQGLERFTTLAVVRMLTPGAYLIGSLVAFIAFRGSLLAIMAATSLATATTTVIATATAQRASRGLTAAPPRDSTNRELAGYGSKLLLGTTSPLESFRLDQAVVGFLLPAQALGIYSTGVALSNLPRLAAYSMGLVGLPYVARQPGPTERRKAVLGLWAVGTALSATVAGSVFLVAEPLIVLLFGEPFRTAAPVAELLLVAAVLAGSRRSLTDALIGAGAPADGTRAELLSWAILGCSALPLANAYGADGVAVALGLSSAAALAYLARAALRTQNA